MSNTDIRWHEMKSQPQFFSEILAGRKTHDLRQADRSFRVGDLIRLREWLPDQEQYTGREAILEVTYITDCNSPCANSPAALHPDFCILSVKNYRKDIR